ncbi:unnamed protein product, partial [Mesorhabditis belari]|uniref:Uncharacterized protein n=1 Tax=Mesorhabditis belari TaxID=2138241 RepID=A0AAF3EMW4_9BILA
MADISQLLQRIKVEDFENVDKFYLTSKVDTQTVARKLMFETMKCMPNWENLKPSGDKEELEKYLAHQEVRAKTVQRRLAIKRMSLNSKTSKRLKVKEDWLEEQVSVVAHFSSSSTKRGSAQRKQGKIENDWLKFS